MLSLNDTYRYKLSVWWNRFQITKSAVIGSIELPRKFSR